MNTGEIKKVDFILVPNKVFELSLSIAAIGLLILIIQQKDSIKKESIKEKSKLGTFKFNKIFKELQDKGVINTVRKNINGRFTYTHEINL